MVNFEIGCCDVFIQIRMSQCIHVSGLLIDIPRMCASEDFWTVWSAANTGGHTLPSALPVALCL